MLLLNISLIVALVPLISGNYSPIRQKRDVIEQAKEFGLNVGGIFLDKINDGAALKLNQESEVQVLDSKFSTGHNAKIGVGDAMRDDDDSGDYDRKKRSTLKFINRIKRAPCGRKNKSTTPPTDTEP